MLDNKRIPYYRIINKIWPLSFNVKSQLIGVTTKTYVRHIKPAEINKWEISNVADGMRKHIYVVSQEYSDDESDAQEKSGLDRLFRVKQQGRLDSLDKDDISITEL